MTEQENLIGKHPLKTHILGEWLTHTDEPITKTKKHRRLEENDTFRKKAVEYIARWIVKHHIIEGKIDALKRKCDILKKHDFPEYVESLNLLPTVDKTKKGNFAEIILAEYLEESSGLSQIIIKLRYNPNVEQSMKGDDVLLLNKKNVLDKIIYGESKFRTISSKQSINSAVSNLEGSKKLPVSIGFVVDRLYERGDTTLADELMDLQSLLKNNQDRICNVGFLLGSKSTTPSKDTSTQVEKHLSTNNPNLVFISLGINNPEKIVDESFNVAKNLLLRIK